MRASSSSKSSTPFNPRGGGLPRSIPPRAVVVAAARAAAADDDGAGATTKDAAADAPAAALARAPPLPAYTSVAPLSAEARARDAEAARELAARTRAALAARLLEAAGRVAEADAAERRRERQQRQRQRQRQRRRPTDGDDDEPPRPPPPLSPEEAVRAAVPVVLERADPGVVAWQQRRRRRTFAGAEDDEAATKATTTAASAPQKQRRQRAAEELSRLVAPHLPAAVRLATAAALERARGMPYLHDDEAEDEQKEEEEQQQQQQRQLLLFPSSSSSPPAARPPPPPAPSDPDALVAAVRACLPPPRGGRIAVFKGGGYRYDDLEASIAAAKVGHVFRLTNLALKARCVLSTERWLSSGRRASLAQHRALAAARRIPLFVVPPGKAVDARALCWAARALLVAKGVLAPGEGETRAGLEAEVEAAVPSALPADGGDGGDGDGGARQQRRRRRPVGFRMQIGSKSEGL